MDAQEQQRQLAALCQQDGGEALYALGSRAHEVAEWAAGRRGRLAPGPSDVDLGAKPRPQTRFGLREQVELALALEELLGVSQVDLVPLREADPFLAANIIRGARFYARDPYLADEYELYGLRRAGDLAPLERERLRLILEEGRT